VNGSSTTIRSGSLRSVGAHVRNRRVRSKHEAAAERAWLPTRTDAMAHHIDHRIDREDRYRRVTGPPFLVNSARRNDDVLRIIEANADGWLMPERF
jgi:hypothetical protein